MRGGQLTHLGAGQVDLVFGEEDLALGDELLEQLGVRPTDGQVLADRLAGDIVRRGGGQLSPIPVAVAVCRVATRAVDHDVAVAHAGVERHAIHVHALGELAEQPPALGRRDVPGGVVLHLAVDHGDQVDAEDPGSASLSVVPIRAQSTFQNSSSAGATAISSTRQAHSI